uniref:Uncharacterized protein n=1 Tax=Cucumis melo TaxID=3656 RepID=A0A9I9ED65_CUCME
MEKQNSTYSFCTIMVSSGGSIAFFSFGNYLLCGDAYDLVGTPQIYTGVCPIRILCSVIFQVKEGIRRH